MSRMPPLSHSPESLSEDKHDQRRSRRPLSCKECTRRKIKCDKNIPCRACSERGEGNLCRRRPAPVPRPRPPQPVNGAGAVNGGEGGSGNVNASLVAELANLRRRVARVEAVLKLDDNEPASKSDEAPEFRENGLAGAIEEAALGIGEIQRLQGFPDLTEPEPLRGGDHRWFSALPLSECLAALPSQQVCQALIDAFCEHLNWMCGCVHVPTLTRLYNDFWTLPARNQSQDGMFLVLLFAILSNAAFLLDDSQLVAAGLVPQQLRRSAPIWFDCCLATFFRCHGMTRPSLMACQAMVTLNYAFHLTRNTRIHVTICAIIAAMARAMNLHLLGGEYAGSPEDVVRREIGRRIWWHMTETEWYFFTYHRYSTITPNQFNTAMPNLMDDGTYASSIKGDAPHELSFILAGCQSARVLYDLYCTLQPTQNPSYEAVLSASDELERIRSRFPSEVEVQSDTSTVKPGRFYMTRVIGMVLAYRLYLIHRSYFVKSLNNASYRQSHTTCLMAAETILNLADRGIPLTFYRLWDITLYLIAAGIVLALDLLATNTKRSPPEILSRRGKLNTLVELLQNLADQSGIGARGAKLISHLCAMESDISAGRASSMRISRDEILDLVYPRDATSSDSLGGGAPPASEDLLQQNGAGNVAALDMLDGDGMYDPRLSFGGPDISNLAAGLGAHSFVPSAWGGSDAGVAGLSFDVFGVPPDRDQLFGFFSDLMPEYNDSADKPDTDM